MAVGVAQEELPARIGVGRAAEAPPARALGADRIALLSVVLGAAGILVATRIAYGVFTHFAVALNPQRIAEARSLVRRGTSTTPIGTY
jgi:hypothetical protein